MIPAEDIDRRFKFHPATSGTGKAIRHENVREACRALAIEFNELLPDGREKSLAMTHLEEVMMWSNAAIAREGQ